MHYPPDTVWNFTNPNGVVSRVSNLPDTVWRIGDHPSSRNPQTGSAELSLGSITLHFPLPWSAYVRRPC